MIRAKHLAGHQLLVSACLAGAKCSYRAKAKTIPAIKKMIEDLDAVAFCPEIAGGLPVPRENCEILGGDGWDVLRGRARVISSRGKDVTDHYINGAKKVCKSAKKLGIQEAILKSKSPACGYGLIYDGSFAGCLRRGDGVLAAMLMENGIKVNTEKSYKTLKKNSS